MNLTPAQRDAFDRMMTEPPDNSLAEAAFDSECRDAFDRYLDDGWLPNGHDPSHVDERLLEEMPEALDGLIKANDDAELLELAKAVREKRIEIIEQLIADHLPAQRAAA